MIFPLAVPSQLQTKRSLGILIIFSAFYLWLTRGRGIMLLSVSRKKLGYSYWNSSHSCLCHTLIFHASWIMPNKQETFYSNCCCILTVSDKVKETAPKQDRVCRHSSCLHLDSQFGQNSVLVGNACHLKHSEKPFSYFRQAKELVLFRILDWCCKYDKQ